MLAMILAGGRGTRLHELTKKVAKPAMLQQDAAGVLMQKTAEYTFFLPVRKQMPILMFTEELQMQFHRTLILLIHILRNIFLFSPETIFIK